MVDEAKIRIRIDTADANRQLSELNRKRAGGGKGRKGRLARDIEEAARGPSKAGATVGQAAGIRPSTVGTAALISRFKEQKLPPGTGIALKAVGAVFTAVEGTRSLLPAIEGLVFEILSTGLPADQKERFAKEFRSLADGSVNDAIQTARANITASLKATPQALKIVTDLAGAGVSVPLSDQRDILQAQFLANLADDRADLELAESRKGQIARILGKELVDLTIEAERPIFKFMEHMTDRLTGGGRF